MQITDRVICKQITDPVISARRVICGLRDTRIYLHAIDQSRISNVNAHIKTTNKIITDHIIFVYS